ncbi:MAG: DUF4185 domain-containing protein [Planctomycetia bacterium]|nr:DUF4185 domain-containing protein [Planctomycetia bacterium]
MHTLLFLLLLFTATQAGKPLPELDQLFQQQSGWIGGDGFYSVRLSPHKIAWLFSDTWIGKVENKKRTDATIINNTVVIEDCSSGKPVMSFWYQNREGKPEALFKPARNSRDWYWLQSATMTGSQLAVFMARIEKTDDKSVFGFKQNGQWLAMVSNPQESPQKWKYEQCEVPHSKFEKDRSVCWGGANCQVGDDLYVYGFVEQRKLKLLTRSLVVARVPVQSVNDFKQWRFYGAGDWHSDPEKASLMAGGMSPEFSVSRLGSEYVLIYTENGLSERILMRKSANPWGALV